MPSWAHSWHLVFCSSVRISFFCSLFIFSRDFSALEIFFLTLVEIIGLLTLERSPKAFLSVFDLSPAFPQKRKTKGIR
jgi:hypothetical protein